MTITLGLTGSIGMGKSTTAKLFAQKGCDVWDADAAVAELYAKGGLAVSPLSAVFPKATEQGFVDKDILKAYIKEDKNALSQIETIVHPLVQKHRVNFKNTAKAGISVFDIPLLFETGAETEFDATACVYVDADTQRRRVLARPRMTADHFESINAKQMPNDAKLQKVDYKIPTHDMVSTQTAVDDIIQDLRERFGHA